MYLVRVIENGVVMARCHFDYGSFCDIGYWLDLVAYNLEDFTVEIKGTTAEIPDIHLTRF